MKNKIYIDIDTDREQPILIGKGPEITPPTNREEASKMINNDIACLCDALLNLIHVADQNEYANKEFLVNEVKNQLDQYLDLPKKDLEETK